MLGGMAASMQALDEMARLEAERIKRLEDNLPEKEKREYEQLKKEVIRKNKKTWNKARLVGAVGILTLLSGLYFGERGFRETNRNLEKQTVTQKNSQESFQAYTENRSHFFDYAWLAVISGNAICTTTLITNSYIRQKRAAPVIAYLESHTK